jgi:hypothetical protein
MEIFLFWIGLAIVIGVAAHYRGRSGFGWMLLAMILSPILIGLLLFVIPRVDVSVTVQQTRSSRNFAALMALWVIVLVFGFVGLIAYNTNPPPAQQQSQSSTECRLTPEGELFRVCESFLGSSEFLRCGFVVRLEHPEWSQAKREAACAGASKEWKRFY